jgi:hypothetical protein
MGTLKFSGHESFQCRNLWLKKGLDFLTQPEDKRKNFNDDLAVIDLGVGKNMVSSIQFWMKAFNIIGLENERPTWLAEYLFGENGRDLFLEDLGTLWLLHFHLVKQNQASIYSLLFNEFRKQRIEFTKSQLKNFLINKCNELGEKHSPNTIETDIGVLLKNYVKPDLNDGRKSIEDQYSSLLIDLDLIKRFTNTGINGNEWYRIESGNRAKLPNEIFFYSILVNYPDNKSISLHKLLNDKNSPGLVFALNPDTLVEKVKAISNQFEDVVYTEDGGIRELQINREFEEENILDQYYGRN